MKKKESNQVEDGVRQGDVYLARVDAASSPKGEEIPREQGAVVLAYGESSGHRHQLAAKGCKLFQRGSARFLEIGAKGGAMLEVSTDRGEPLNPPRHTEISIEKGTHEVVRQREWSMEDERQVAD